MSTADYLNQLEQDREDLVDNLEAKGITGLSGDETFTQLVPEVLNIPSGGNTGAYYVNTTTEMNALTGMQDGNYCVVNALPSEYKPIEYLEGTGTQYIDTNYVPIKATTEIKFQSASIPAAHETAETLAGVWNTSNQRYYVAIVNYSTNKFVTANRSNSQTTLANYDNNVHTIIYNDASNKVLFDGVSKATISDTTSGTNTMFLFGFNDDGPATGIFQGRIYYVKITNKATNSLVRFLVPCVRKSDNVPGLYDFVYDYFFTNQGTGDFVVGNDTYSSYYKVYQYNTQDGWVLVSGNIVN